MDYSFCITFILVFVVRGVQLSSFIFTEDTVQTERYQKGKEKYELFRGESRMPQYSACWTDALSSLETGCKHLTDDIQHRLALKFSNCFLKKTGRETYECSEMETIAMCTGHMASEAYNVYTEFFTHTQNICYFLQAQTWQQETEKTIDELADTSAHVAKQLEDSSHLQTDLLQKQNESIKNQQILISHGAKLKQTLEDSTADVQVMLREFKDSTSEQKALIFEVFDRLTALQNIVMGEFTGFYSLIFYTVSVLVCYLLTSTPRTSGARFWLFLLMTANVVAERMIVGWGSDQYQDAETGTVVDESTQLYRRLWWCRKFFSVLGIAVWLRCAIRYRDYNKINNELLVEIRKQNSDLKHLLQTGSPKSACDTDVKSLHDMNIDGVDSSIVSSTNEDLGRQKPWSVTSAIKYAAEKETTTGYESESDTGSECSFNTTMTDHTFSLNNLHDVDESERDSYSPNVSRASSLRSELRHLRDCTPFREMASYSICEADVSSSASPASARTKKGRPKASQNKKPPASRVVENSGRYNLRSRNHGATPVNPVVHTESAENVGGMVRHLAKVARRNAVKAEVTVARNLIKQPNKSSHHMFSSDDD